MKIGQYSKTSKMDIFERLYVSPQVCIMDVQTEGFLCVSGASGTDDLLPGDSWEGLL